MASPRAPGADPVDVPRLDVPEIVLALAHSSIRRARLLAQLGSDLIQKRQPLASALAWIDGNESDMEELTLRWRLAGVRWPIAILLSLACAAGFQAGRRRR